MTAPETTAVVAVELERLRGVCMEGFAEVKGSLARLVDRSDRNEQDVRDLRADVEGELTTLRAELDGVQRTRWRAQGALLGAAAALGGGAGYLGAALGG